MNRGSHVPGFGKDAISEINEAIKRLSALRKVFRELGKLLSVPDPSVDELQKKLDMLGSFHESGPLAGLVPLAFQERDIYRTRIEEIKTKRSDVRARREEFVRLARDGGWGVQSTGIADFVGPYKVQHDERRSIVSFGKYMLKKISYPSGGNILDTLRKVSKKMEEDALKGWGEFMERVVAAQERISATEPVPWEELLTAAVPDKSQQRRLGRLYCYRLSLLISGKTPGGWKAVVVPPALAEQRSAWKVPRLDRPNDVLRVHRLRLKKIIDQTADAGGELGPPIT